VLDAATGADTRGAGCITTIADFETATEGFADAGRIRGRDRWRRTDLGCVFAGEELAGATV